MTSSPEMLAAFRELTTTKQLERSDLLELLRDGIQAALVRKFGPNVKFELTVDELQGSIKIVRLRQVVETVEDPSAQVSLEEARYEDPDFAVGDMLEEEVPFHEFGRLAVQAAKQRIIQRVREGERARIAAPAHPRNRHRRASAQRCRSRRSRRPIEPGPGDHPTICRSP